LKCVNRTISCVNEALVDLYYVGMGVGHLSVKHGGGMRVIKMPPIWWR